MQMNFSEFALKYYVRKGPFFAGNPYRMVIFFKLYKREGGWQILKGVTLLGNFRVKYYFFCYWGSQVRIQNILQWGMRVVIWGSYSTYILGGGVSQTWVLPWEN